MNDKYSATRNAGVLESYRVACPDVLQLEVAGRTNLNRLYPIGPDGRIDLSPYGNPRVEGQGLGEVARAVAEQVGVEADKVRVCVARFQSERVYLFGQVIGWQRSVPYRGPETVLDLLQRVGGITPGAAPDDVLVVRPHIVDARRPEVFHVDLAAIVLRRDERTNIRIMPEDQIYVGETRQARVEKSLPPWMRRVYQRFWNTRPSFKSTDEGQSSAWVTPAQPAAESVIQASQSK